ncbi:MAG: coproporphyrinogen dehydrogenase HemZ [Clostridia bacterium]|nr:coproporphyrinogen dehydrogenase HemZ [Clostridia bacterium]
MNVTINQADFQYDIHSLVKAFYPEEDVTVRQGKTGIDYSGFEIYYSNDQIMKLAYYENGIIVHKITCDIKSAYLNQSIQTDAKERVLFKNQLKQQLYTLLKMTTKKELPWGTLTGIRPTKIALTMMEQGASDEEIAESMRSVYFTTEEKIRLCCEIGRRELNVLSRLHGHKGFSLYIGIPFCPTTCLYCSFTSYPIIKWKEQVDAYIDALEKELALTAEFFHDRILDTVYIGGGTPTTLEPEQMLRLISLIKKYFDLEKGPIQEFTVEAGRPDSITKEKLQVLYDEGVTRISINPQTMNEETLKIIGRKHTVEQVKQAFALARQTGFDNINMDLILGLPGEAAKEGDDSKLRHTLDEIAALQPEGLTIHSLAIKRAAGMHEWLLAHPEVKSINTPQMMTLVEEKARAQGLVPYYLYRQKNMTGNLENVGYAKPDKIGIYNILIMEEKQTIAAVGAGTISKVVLKDGRIERCDNIKDIKLYLEKNDEILMKKRAFYTKYESDIKGTEE